jgi:AcrR family transcriptional regulator
MTSNLEGQTMGRKGQETRARLLDAALKLLDATPLRELRAADLARKAEISPASFYLYFENVEALVLTLAERVAEEAAPLLEQARAEWSWTGKVDHVEVFVRAYFDFWDRHRSILRVRNLAAEEGNWSFQNARMRVTAPLHQELAAKIDGGRALGVIDDGPHSLTLASIALAGLERSAATYIMFPRKYGVTRERLIEAAIYMLKTIVLGRNPDR